MKDLKELRSFTKEQLNNELISLRRQQFDLRLQKANGVLDKTHLVTQTRKAIAKIKTIITEKAGNSNGNQ